MDQKQAEALLATIYTPEKKAEWKKCMDEAGERFQDESDKSFGFNEYMAFRRALRKRLGYPA